MPVGQDTFSLCVSAEIVRGASITPCSGRRWGSVLVLCGLIGALPGPVRGDELPVPPAAEKQPPFAGRSVSPNRASDRAFQAGPPEREARALREQDLGICLGRLGRGAEAAVHYRAAIRLDPYLRIPWASLASQALGEGALDRAVHLASVAQFLDRRNETTRQLLQKALAGLPGREKRMELAPKPCAAPSDAEEPGAGDAAGAAGEGALAGVRDTAVPGPPSGGRSEARPPNQEDVRACLERRAGWFAGEGPESAAALAALAQLDLDAGSPASAVLMLTLARAVGDIPAGRLADARARAGNPCGAAELDPGSAAFAVRCESFKGLLTESAVAAEEILPPPDEAAGALMRQRLEELLAAGMDPAAAARRLRYEASRGPFSLYAPGPFVIRLGEQWFEDQGAGVSGVHVWRRRPGDTALVALLLIKGEALAQAAVGRLLAPRNPFLGEWTAASFAATDPVLARSAQLSIDTDAVGRAEGSLWLAESPAAPGRALLLAAFPGTGGLGEAGADQARQEIEEAVAGAILEPSTWATLQAAPAEGGELPVPVPRDRGEDEREAPWRTVGLAGGEFSVALPPNSVAALPEVAPLLSAPSRPTAVLWFRGRFVDRAGEPVAIGDERIAGSIDLTPIPSDPRDPIVLALRSLSAPPAPLADPRAALVSAVDATALLGAETGAIFVSLARYSPSSRASYEWLIARLLYPNRSVELAIPTLAGRQSLALYWIASTVRAAHDPPPPPPVDLTGRLGIAFLRPPPSERRESFYKEGDLRSRDFTLIVPRDYRVNLNTGSLDAFPVRLTPDPPTGLIVFDRIPRAPGPSAGSSAPGAGGSLTRALAETVIRGWLDRLGARLAGNIETASYERAGRNGAAGGIEASFEAEVTAAGVAAEGRGRGSGAPEASGSGEGRTRGWGRATLLEAQDGRLYCVVSLCWGEDRKKRQDEARLVLGSLRLLARARGSDKGAGS